MQQLKGCQGKGEIIILVTAGQARAQPFQSHRPTLIIKTIISRNHPEVALRHK